MNITALTQNQQFSRKISRKQGEPYVDSHGWHPSAIAIFFHPSHGRSCPKRQSLPDSGGETALAGAWEGGQRVPSQASGPECRTNIGSSAASRGIDRAEHEPVDRSGDRRNGSLPRGGPVALRLGAVLGHDRSDEHRVFPKSTDRPRRREPESHHRAGRAGRGVHRDIALLFGYHGSGSSDRLSHGSWTYEEDRREADRHRIEDPQGRVREAGQARRASAEALHENSALHAGRLGKGGQSEKEARQRASKDGCQNGAIASRRTRADGTCCSSKIPGELGPISQDAFPNSLLDPHRISSAWQDRQSLGAGCSSHYSEQSWQSRRVRPPVDHHAIGARLHYRKSLPETWVWIGYWSDARDPGSFHANYGSQPRSGRLRSWRRRPKESSSDQGPGNQELYLPQGQGELAWDRQEHGAQGPPRAGPLGSDDRYDQKPALRLQQTQGEVIGGVYSQGASRHFWGESDASDAGLGNGDELMRGGESRDFEYCEVSRCNSGGQRRKSIRTIEPDLLFNRPFPASH